MAIGKASDFKVYNDQINGGFVEISVQATDLFNTASRNAIRLVTNITRGDYVYESFMKNTAGLITRRDTTSVAAVTDLPLTQDEMISVKLNRKIGPVAQTLDAWRKIARAGNLEEMQRVLGQQWAKDLQIDKLNTAVRAGVAAIGAQADLVHDATSGTITTPGLVDGLAKFGDAGSRILVWVMHSKVYYDLVKEQIAANIDGISNFNVASGTPVTLNRPVLVTDSPDLINPLSPTPQYYTLGLVADGIVIEDSEGLDVEGDVITGLQNLVGRIQGELAYNTSVKGTKWDVANGGVNPVDAAVGTGSNWDKIAANVKDMAGVRIDSL